MNNQYITNRIDVSILIVNYNSFKLLQNCLNSIVNHSQDFEYEIIVIDNNSNEGNIEDVIDKYDDIVMIKNSKNIGFAAANNFAAKHANGKYLLLLNNDTLLTENSILDMLDFAKNLNGNFILVCKLLNEDSSLQNSAYKFPSIRLHFAATFFIDKIFPKSNSINKYYIDIAEKKEPTIVNSVIGAFIFIPKDTFNKLDGFDERFFFYHEDTDLCYRLREIGGSVYYYPETSIIHYGGGTTNRNLWFSMKNRFISRIQFAQKHFNSLDKILFVLIEYIGIIIRVPLFFLTGIILFNKNYLKRSVLSLRLIFIYPQNKFKPVNP
ncbi:MAG: glycosyltransferase family 2 protein [Bacteroidetes bacterium]|nr:glycosyltransferase family 2 protein [Bacteroidota bacterium]